MFDLRICAIHKFEPYKIVEEDPLMRIELIEFHDGNHFNELESSPQQIEVVFLFNILCSLKNAGKKEHNKLPEVG